MEELVHLLFMDSLQIIMEETCLSLQHKAIVVPSILLLLKLEEVQRVLGTNLLLHQDITILQVELVAKVLTTPAL